MEISHTISYKTDTVCNHMQSYMFVKQKILATLTKHPKVMMFGIGLAVTAAVALAIGGTMAPYQSAMAAKCGGCWDMW